jgi:hypothetical protein
MVHDGPLYGWRHELQGAQSLGNDIYRVWVPNDESVEIRPVIEALEKPACAGVVKKSMAQLLKSLLPAVKSSSQCTRDINGLLDQLTIQCADLYRVLDEVAAFDWGHADGWMDKMVDLIKSHSGCGCK